MTDILLYLFIYIGPGLLALKIVHNAILIPISTWWTKL